MYFVSSPSTKNLSPILNFSKLYIWPDVLKRAYDNLAFVDFKAQYPSFGHRKASITSQGGVKREKDARNREKELGSLLFISWTLEIVSVSGEKNTYS